MNKKNFRAVGILAMALALGACATMSSGTDASRLAGYSPYLQPAVKSIRYSQARNWEKITDHHVLLEIRGNEQYLLKLDGPCLQFSNGSPSLIVDSNMSGMLSAGQDRIGTMESRITCLIREIRPVDTAAMQAAEKR